MPNGEKSTHNGLKPTELSFLEKLLSLRNKNVFDTSSDLSNEHIRSLKEKIFVELNTAYEISYEIEEIIQQWEKRNDELIKAGASNKKIKEEFDEVQKKVQLLTKIYEPHGYKKYEKKLKQFLKMLDEMVDHSQSVILKKLRSFIAIIAKKNKEEIAALKNEYIKKGASEEFAVKKAKEKLGIYRSEDIEHLFTKGQCAGLADLWLFYKSHGKENVFFNEIREIALWDEKPESLEENKHLVEKISTFINEMRFYQEGLSTIWSPQREVHLAHQVFSTEEMHKVFSMTFLFKEQELNKTLKHILKEGHMFQVVNQIHAIGIYTKKVNGKLTYFVYDSNARRKNTFLPSHEVSFEKISDLVNYLKQQLFDKLNLPTDLMPLGINAFSSRDKSAYAAKENEEVLDWLFTNDSSATKRRTLDNLDLAMICAKHGDIETMKYCLEKNYDINKRISILDVQDFEKMRLAGNFTNSDQYPRHETTLLEEALGHGQARMAKFLLDRGAKPGKNDLASFEKYITLEEAIRNKDSLALEIFSKLGQDLRPKAEQKPEAVLFTKGTTVTTTENKEETKKKQEDKPTPS